MHSESKWSATGGVRACSCAEALTGGSYSAPRLRFLLIWPAVTTRSQGSAGCECGKGPAAASVWHRGVQMWAFEQAQGDLIDLAPSKRNNGISQQALNHKLDLSPDLPARVLLIFYSPSGACALSQCWTSWRSSWVTWRRTWRGCPTCCPGSRRCRPVCRCLRGASWVDSPAEGASLRRSRWAGEQPATRSARLQESVFSTVK